MTNIAIENGHWNIGFSHEKWWFSIVMLVYQRVAWPLNPVWAGSFSGIQFFMGHGSRDRNKMFQAANALFSSQPASQKLWVVPGSQSLVGNIPLDWIVPVTMSRRCTELVEISTFKHFICLFVRSEGSKSGTPTFPGIELEINPLLPIHLSMIHHPTYSIPIHTLTQLIIENLPIPSPTIGSCYPIHQPLGVILHHPK